MCFPRLPQQEEARGYTSKDSELSVERGCGEYKREVGNKISHDPEKTAANGLLVRRRGNELLLKYPEQLEPIWEAVQKPGGWTVVDVPAVGAAYDAIGVMGATSGNHMKGKGKPATVSEKVTLFKALVLLLDGKVHHTDPDVQEHWFGLGKLAPIVKHGRLDGIVHKATMFTAAQAGSYAITAFGKGKGTTRFNSFVEVRNNYYYYCTDITLALTTLLIMLTTRR